MREFKQYIICTYIIKHRNESFSFHLCNFLGKQTEVKRKLIERERGTVFFARNGVEKVEIDDVELVKLLDQFNNASL